MKGKPQWAAKKYMGDDSYSWAVIDKRYLTKGHRGVIFDYLPSEAIMYTGLTRDSAQFYVRQNSPSKKRKCLVSCMCPKCHPNGDLIKQLTTGKRATQI